MVAILDFLGTNCQYDMQNIYKELGYETTLVWHTQECLPQETKLAVVPGGFSYGDYLRCGAIAAQAKSIKALKKYAENGGRVLGICNGFQILCESRMLPGILMRNKNLKFIAKNVKLAIHNADNAMFKDFSQNQEIAIPVAHGEGNYQIDSKGLESLYANNQVLLRYSDDINGSVDNIAGICNKERNIYALMPHPERAVNLSVINHGVVNGSIENIVGVKILKSLYEA